MLKTLPHRPRQPEVVVVAVAVAVALVVGDQPSDSVYEELPSDSDQR